MNVPRRRCAHNYECLLPKCLSAVLIRSSECRQISSSDHSRTSLEMESVVVVARTLAISALLIGGLKIGPAVGAELQAPTPQNPPSYYSEEPVEFGPPIVYAPPPPPVYYAYRVAPIVPGPYYLRRPYGLAYGRSYVWAHGPGGPRFGGYGPRGGRHLRW
jgi:hypothetical protein